MSRARLIVCIVAAFLTAGTAAFAARGEDPFDLSWFTIDGGGMMFSTGDDYELSGTIGQADAGAMSGAEFELTGGFWFRIPLGDCEDDGDVDLLDYNQLESCLTGPDSPVATECRCSDVNRSGTIDLLDFAVAQRNFTGS